MAYRILNSASPHRCVDDQSIKDVLNSLWSEGDRESVSMAQQMEMVAARRKSARSSTLSVEKKTAGSCLTYLICQTSRTFDLT